MGNVCPWCFKNQDDSHTNGNLGDNSGMTNSQRSLTSSEPTDRTPLIQKPGSNKNNHSVVSNGPYSETNGESSSSSLPTIAPLPPPPLSLIEQNPGSTTISSNETAETKMAFIVEGMLSKLIDVGNGSSGVLSTNPKINGVNNQNDHLRQSLNKSLSSTRVLTLPDAGLANLPSLLSGRPISSDICHFVAHTAGELSRLLIDEIKITHKEELVVVFE